MPTMTQDEADARTAELTEDELFDAWINANPPRRAPAPCDPDRCQRVRRLSGLAAVALGWLDKGQTAHARELLRELASL